MKLCATPGSPYARMARIVVIEKGLERRVEGICAYLDQLDGRPAFQGVIRHEKDRAARLAARASFKATEPPAP